MNNTIPVIPKNFRNALISNIEFNNGDHTQMITIFNTKELHFEEINMGVNAALKRISNIKSSKSTFCVIEKGSLKESAFFDKKNY